MVKKNYSWKYALVCLGFFISVVPPLYSLLQPQAERIYDWDMFAEPKEICTLVRGEYRSVGQEKWQPIENYYRKSTRYHTPMVKILLRTREFALRAYCHPETHSVRGFFRCIDHSGNTLSETLEAVCKGP
jgi:hypothetical protein